MDIRFVPCTWQDIGELVAARLRERRALVESFWEDHVLGAKHYMMLQGEETVGYFAIHGKETLVLFDVLPAFAHLSQELFARVKKYETVTGAMLSTGDTLFLGLCIDGFARMEKQAYFVTYTDRKRQKNIPLVSLGEITFQQDRDAFLKCGDFFSKEELERLEKGEAPHQKVFLARRDGTPVGLGVMEAGRVLTENASIGMCVYEEYRCQGNAVAILEGLKAIAYEKGLTPVAGCWYYNHNSKKSLEASGGYCQERLVRFYF